MEPRQQHTIEAFFLDRADSREYTVPRVTGRGAERHPAGCLNGPYGDSDEWPIDVRYFDGERGACSGL